MTTLDLDLDVDTRLTAAKLAGEIALARSARMASAVSGAMAARDLAHPRRGFFALRHSCGAWCPEVAQPYLGPIRQGRHGEDITEGAAR